MGRGAVAKRRGDWIAVLEAGYSLDGDDPAWLNGLLECIGREHWPGLALTAFMFDSTAQDVGVSDVQIHGRPEIHDYIRESMKGASAGGIDRIFRSGVVVGTLSEV